MHVCTHIYITYKTPPKHYHKTIKNHTHIKNPYPTLENTIVNSSLQWDKAKKIINTPTWDIPNSSYQNYIKTFAPKYKTINYYIDKSFIPLELDREGDTRIYNEERKH